MKLAVVTQIRNESKRLREWISFHYKIHKFDYFYFYLDNPEDDSEQVLLELKKEFPIDYEFTNFGEGHTYNGNIFFGCEGAVFRQRTSLNSGYHKLKYDYDWVAIFDVDEWIVPVDIHNFNLKQFLSETDKNLLYIPMYNFKPPFDYDKSIVEQNMYRWSTDHRFEIGEQNNGKSIIRGKFRLDEIWGINVHYGPEGTHGFTEGMDLSCPNHLYRLYQWQCHGGHANKKYQIFDDRIIKLINTIEL